MEVGHFVVLCPFAMEQNGTQFGFYGLFLVNFTNLIEAY
jgi:hypothetical protein